MAGRKALITGITGQDGALLARFLLRKGYQVHGLRLYSATDDTARIASLMDDPDFYLHTGDLTDGGALWRLLADIRPDEIYNLAAQSHVQASFAVPEATAQINALGTLRLLEALRGLDEGRGLIRFYQASSSEMFGNAPAPQNEGTPLTPCSPYGAAKIYACHLTRIYRESYGLHASNGILFNHESPLRGEEFVTRKITRAVAAIAAGQQNCLMIGNLEARRDWGHAADYVRGMWLMLRQDVPGDYVLATGQARSVREFVTAAFAVAGIDLVWQGQGLTETACARDGGAVLVRVDPQFFRPAEVHELIGDAARARQVLGWAPEIGFDALVEDMVRGDLAALQGEPYESAVQFAA